MWKRLMVPGPKKPESFESWRASRHVARMATICSVVLGMTTVSLCALVVVILPLKEVRPMFVTFREKGDQVVRIEPVERNVRGMDQLVEGMARQYVQLRETFDLQTERQRWSQVALMSSPEIASSLREDMNPSREGSPLKRRMEDQATRTVRILSSACLTPDGMPEGDPGSSPDPSELNGDGGLQGFAPDQRAVPSRRVYQVEWVSEDRHKGQVVGEECWQTTMTVCLEEREMDYENQFVNPIGFTVTRYTIARKNRKDFGEKQK